MRSAAEVPGEPFVLRADVERRRDLVDRVDVDDGRQLLDERTVALLGSRERSFGVGALRHVLDQALPDRAVVAPIHDGRGVMHPDDRSILADEPIFGVERLARPVGPPGFGDDRGAVVFMDARLPEPGGGPLLGREPCEIEHPRRDVVDTVSFHAILDAAAIGHGRDLLHERAISLFCRLQRPLSFAFRGDVVHHAAVPGLTRAGDRCCLVVDPHLSARGCAHAVVRRESVARRDGLAPRREHPVEVVRVHLPGPQMRVHEPPLGIEPEQTFDLRTDVGHGSRARAGDRFPRVGHRGHLLDHRLILGFGLRAARSFGSSASALEQGEDPCGQRGDEEDAERHTGETGNGILDCRLDRSERVRGDPDDAQRGTAEHDHHFVPARRPLAGGPGLAASS